MNKTVTRTILTLIAIATSIISCRRSESDMPDDYNGTKIPLGRVDQFVYTYNKGDVMPDSLLTGIELYAAMLGNEGFVDDSLLHNISQSRVVRVFGHDITDRFSSADSIAQVLGYINERAVVETGSPLLIKAYSIASPYRQSIVIADTIVLVALNHYLGADYEGYESIPYYQRRFKTSHYIPRDIVQALVRNKYPYIEKDGTLLEHIIYEGFVAECVERLTGSDEATALGVTNDDYTELQKRKIDLWQVMMSDRLIYSTDPSIIDRLITPAPYTVVGNSRYPALAGVFIGHEIIKTYLLNSPDGDINSLWTTISSQTPQQLLISSKFSPK